MTDLTTPKAGTPMPRRRVLQAAGIGGAAMVAAAAAPGPRGRSSGTEEVPRGPSPTSRRPSEANWSTWVGYMDVDDDGNRPTLDRFTEKTGTHPDRHRDAARRLQGLRIRQGHEHLLLRGVHEHQARLAPTSPAWSARTGTGRSSATADRPTDPRQEHDDRISTTTARPGTPMPTPARAAGRGNRRRGDGRGRVRRAGRRAPPAAARAPRRCPARTEPDQSDDRRDKLNWSQLGRATSTSTRKPEHVRRSTGSWRRPASRSTTARTSTTTRSSTRRSARSSRRARTSDATSSCSPTGWPRSGSARATPRSSTGPGCRTHAT